MAEKPLKHGCTDEDRERRASYVLYLCERQGITLEQLYHIVPSVAERAKVYKSTSKWYKP